MNACEIDILKNNNRGSYLLIGNLRATNTKNRLTAKMSSLIGKYVVIWKYLKLNVFVKISLLRVCFIVTSRYLGTYLLLSLASHSL